MCWMLIRLCVRLGGVGWLSRSCRCCLLVCVSICRFMLMVSMFMLWVVCCFSLVLSMLFWIFSCCFIVSSCGCWLIFWCG